jgi:hypothetical protein
VRFTAKQYDEAIGRLVEGKQQLEPDGHCCAICGDSGHAAFECGFNPLVAMFLCREIAEQSEALHETLHYLAGYDSRFGEQLGPRKIVMPEGGGPADAQGIQ